MRLLSATVFMGLGTVMGLCINGDEEGHWQRSELIAIADVTQQAIVMANMWGRWTGRQQAELEAADAYTFTLIGGNAQSSVDTFYSGSNSLFEGHDAGMYETRGDHLLLLGDCVQAPPGNTRPFANFGNAVCWYRDNGQRAVCPPLVHDCKK